MNSPFRFVQHPAAPNLASPALPPHPFFDGRCSDLYSSLSPTDKARVDLAFARASQTGDKKTAAIVMVRAASEYISSNPNLYGCLMRVAIGMNGGAPPELDPLPPPTSVSSNGPRSLVAPLPVHPGYPCAAEIQKVPPMIQAFVMARIADVAAFYGYSSDPNGVHPVRAWVGGSAADKIAKEVYDAIAFLAPYYTSLAWCFGRWCVSLGMPLPPFESFSTLSSNETQGPLTLPWQQATSSPSSPSVPMQGPRPLVRR